MGSGGSLKPKYWSVGGRGVPSSGGDFLNSFTPAGMMGFNYNDPTGKKGAADAAQRSANAQAAEAREQRRIILEQGQKNQREAMALADATPQELAALGRAYSSAQSALDREEKLMGAIDPALMEASSQVLALLRGESSAMNKPMNDMRSMQRQQLVNSLRAQYGPGAESSSIGQKALSRFDMETNSLMASNNQNSLAQAFGIASSDFGGRLQRGIAGLQQVGQGYSALQERKLNTQLNTGNAMLGALSGTSQQMIQNAGAPYVGQALQSQMQNQLFNTGVKAGASILGEYIGAQNGKK